MKEIILLSIGAVSSIFILGYSVHMLLGGVVAPETERIVIIVVCSLGAIVAALMGVDILRQRRRR